MKSVTIINYGMGNLKSVRNAFEVLGASVEVVDSPREMNHVNRIVLPGVGAFGDAMHNLRTMGWVDALEKEVRQKQKPFLGLCLGIQVLATTGTEHGHFEGLNWIPGTVKRIKPADPTLRIPHIGWNDVEIVRDDGLYQGLGKKQAFYFVHSYVICPEDPTVITGLCEYGTRFCASLQFQNIMATQYHPEKSHKTGLAMLKNFLNL